MSPEREELASAIQRINHKGRSLLTSAKLALSGLEHAPLSERAQKRLQIAEASLLRLEQLFDELEAQLPADSA